MRGLLRRRQRGGTCENETSRAGLRPDGVYVYAERSQGRVNRPFIAGEHRCGEASRTMSGKPAQARVTRLQRAGTARRSEILDCGADFGESADGIETGAKSRGTGPAVEISEKMDMHLHRCKRVLGRNVVAGETLGKLPAKLQ